MPAALAGTKITNLATVTKIIPTIFHDITFREKLKMGGGKRCFYQCLKLNATEIIFILFLKPDMCNQRLRCDDIIYLTVCKFWLMLQSVG